MPNLTIVLPTYNERENLLPIADALFKLGIDGLNLLIVDDNSPDGTGQLADELASLRPSDVRVIHRTEKNGLGPAYREGFKAALAAGADLIVQMDSDFSHQPKYIPVMMREIENGADLVIGSRYLEGGGVDEGWSFYRKLLSWFANSVYVKTLLRLPISDATAGYRMWKREALIGLNLDRIKSNGYVFQVEMAYVAHRMGFRIREIPIYFPDRQQGRSKMNARIQLEAALRVWQLLIRHRRVAKQPRVEPYESSV